MAWCDDILCKCSFQTVFPPIIAWGQNVRFADTATILGFGQAEQRSLSWNRCHLQKVDRWADSSILSAKISTKIKWVHFKIFTLDYCHLFLWPGKFKLWINMLIYSDEMKFKMSQLFSYLNKPRTSDYRWTELQWNVDFVNGPTVGWPWHFKSNEDIITKSKWHESQIKESTEFFFLLILMIWNLCHSNLVMISLLPCRLLHWLGQKSAL